MNWDTRFRSDPIDMAKAEMRSGDALPLAVHIIEESCAWTSLLESEGVLLANHAPNGQPSVILLPEEADRRKRRTCLELASRGSTVICEKGALPANRLENREIWSMPYDCDNFCCLGNTRDARAIEIEIGEIGDGRVFHLPFRLSDVWADTRRARRFVLIGYGHYIYEDMAAVVKKNVRRVVVDVLKRAFFRKGLPFAHKWYYPGSYRSVLCFRGDADGGPRENFRKWLRTVRPFASCTSVFFCTSRYAHKRDLIASAARTGLEVGSHNHWHIVHPDSLTNQIALNRAENILSSVGCNPRGFVSPAYFWRASMYRHLEERGYDYASSFGISHDSIPYHPVVGKRTSRILEIPFHCLGDRFPRFDIPLDSDITRRFFNELIDKKYLAGEPMFLYGHPDKAGRMGTTPELVRFILEVATSRSDVWPIQLSTYARWWQMRGQTDIGLAYDSVAGVLFSSSATKTKLPMDDLRLRVEFSDGSTYLVAPGECEGRGLPRKALRPYEPLRLAEPRDVGEVVYRGPAERQSHLVRRTLRRYLQAYSSVYLDSVTRPGTPSEHND